MTVPTESDRFYGVEKSEDLKNWSTLETFSGDGSEKTVSFAYEGNPVFFRFVSEADGVLSGPVNYPLSGVGTFSAGSEETAHILAGAGFSSSDELLNHFRSVYRLNDEIERLQAAGVEIDAGGVVNLLREVELRGNLNPLVESGAIDEGTVDSLVEAGISANDLYELMRNLSGPTPASGFVPVSGITPVKGEEVLDRRNREAFLELNNEIATVGGTKLTRTRFSALRNRMKALTPQDDATITETNQDTTAGRSDTGDLPAARELRAISERPSDTTYLRGAAKHSSEARLRIEQLPLHILGSEYAGEIEGTPVYKALAAKAPFTKDYEGSDYRSFLINRECMAWLFIYGNGSGGRLHIQSPDGDTIVDVAIPAQASRAVCLPVTQALVNREFKVLNEGHLNVTLVAMNEICNLDKDRGATGLTVRTDIPTMRRGPAAGCGWYRFSVDEQPSGPQTKVLKLRVNDSSETPLAREAVLIAPDGHLYRQNLTANAETELSVTLAAGAWQLFLLPASSAVLTPDSGFLAGTNAV
ncbi:MAG TPA: hypothetical protein PKI32_05780, partial [Opitutales bacterium]|nr:hypothetical protein [Opitutales bacterium]